MTDIPADPSGEQLDPDLPEQGIDTGATDLPDDELPGDELPDDDVSDDDLGEGEVTGFEPDDPDALDGPGVPDPNADLMRADTDSLPDTQVPGAGPDGQ